MNLFYWNRFLHEGFSMFQNLTKEQADYCISRMKPYQDRSGRALPDAYDYADFTGSMFVN